MLWINSTRCHWRQTNYQPHQNLWLLINVKLSQCWKNGCKWVQVSLVNILTLVKLWDPCEKFMASFLFRKSNTRSLYIGPLKNLQFSELLFLGAAILDISIFAGFWLVGINNKAQGKPWTVFDSIQFTYNS